MTLISVVFFFLFVQFGVFCQDNSSVTTTVTTTEEPIPIKHDAVPAAAEVVQLLDFNSNQGHVVTITNGSIERLFLDPAVSDRDVVVVSITGALRKGKSFLLNYMLRYMYANYKSVSMPDKVINQTEASNWIGLPDEPLKGFSWKSSSKRETVGIIFWSDVFLYDDPNGGKLAIYLMDTQGLFDHSSSPTDNLRIFSLSTLISSFQIMNINGMLEESQLEYLTFATEIARFTAIESIIDSKPFQNLMFLLRDWNSPDEYGYGLQGGNQFIQNYLQIREFHSKALKDVREHLKTTFKSILCFLMPYPGKKTAITSTYDGRWSVIDEEFVEALKELVPVILAPENLTVKTMNGVPVKAFEAAVYIQQYVDLFKSSDLPAAKTISNSMMDNQFQLLMSKAVELYLQSVALYQNKIQKREEIEELHKVAKALALKYYNGEKKFGKEKDGLVYYEELDRKLQKAYNEWSPIVFDNLSAIKTEQDKTNAQVALAADAEKRKAIATNDAVEADQKYLDLKKQIAQARNDTEGARHHANVLLQQFAKAEQERQEALSKEKEARKHYEEMKIKAERLEKQLWEERQKMSKEVEEKFKTVRQRDGISQFFVGIGNGIMSFASFIAQSVGNVFGGLFESKQQNVS